MTATRKPNRSLCILGVSVIALIGLFVGPDSEAAREKLNITGVSFDKCTSLMASCGSAQDMRHACNSERCACCSGSTCIEFPNLENGKTKLPTGESCREHTFAAKGSPEDILGPGARPLAPADVRAQMKKMEDAKEPTAATFSMDDGKVSMKKIHISGAGTCGDCLHTCHGMSGSDCFKRCAEELGGCPDYKPVGLPSAHAVMEGGGASTRSDRAALATAASAMKGVGLAGVGEMRRGGSGDLPVLEDYSGSIIIMKKHHTFRGTLILVDHGVSIDLDELSDKDYETIKPLLGL